MKFLKHRFGTRGAFYAEQLVKPTNNEGIRSCQAQGKSGNWHLSRPMPYFSFIIRLKQAWDVFRYRADALYWDIDFDK